MKIAHISDLHICVENKPENLIKTRRLLEWVLARGCDHLIISGDVSHDACAADFEALRGLLDEYGLLDWRRLTMVIGNHDIFGGIYLATDIPDFPDRCRRTNYTERVLQFARWFSEAFHHTQQPLAPLPFPFVKILDEAVIFGANSIAPYSPLTNIMAAKGRLAGRELAQLKRLMTAHRHSHKPKLVVLHHQFRSRFMAPPPLRSTVETVWDFLNFHFNKLYTKSQLLRLFAEQRVDLVLHGHIHVNAGYEINGVRFLNGGGSLEGGRAHELQSNFIAIEQGNVVVSTESCLVERLPRRPAWLAQRWQPEYAIG
ncbi:MAG: metallophosphoesterase [candidate division KSB1 bacterium]|nr:metallophosphoesterase [candidate division KSB1 bacterium]MDZ7276179.1 metallophosphoesterase [candidate division KSB1 bacterium]MDZ7287041.1 metallophosphoesterase [candidate division KSB1 bacterium]MDZ7297034.1 metallophosphoesterase [candidate division KSB1 bacterium]MDZ7309369.1 metallophosphoesterase [candidate division KSB1 bacterium]